MLLIYSKTSNKDLTKSHWTQNKTGKLFGGLTS